MDKRVILAVAGAGKTYHLCHSIDPQKRNLILAYTHENIHNIQRELISAYGRVPELTMVMTFDSFVYRQIICPYEPSIVEHFNCPQFVNRGVSLVDPPPQRVKGWGGKMVPNPHYFPKDRFGHYITKSRKYYCSTLSELVLQVKKGKESLVKRAALRLNKFYDYVLIDEFQDFREHDYELITTLAKHLEHILLVGDYYQHSVSATNNSGKPFKIQSRDVSYSEFVKQLISMKYCVDEETLNKSRRCSVDICHYVSQKLNISIESNGDNRGSIIWADKNVDVILKNPNIVKLVYKEASRCTFPALSWSYAKGDTFNAVCVILTKDFEKMDQDSFSTQDISTSTINKLYVAMTRSRGDVYLIKASTFKSIKDSYLLTPEK